MKAIADLCVIPLGVGLSVSAQVAECEKILGKYQLKTHLHAYGTNIEGEWDEVFAAIKECHQTLHDQGVPRISSSIKVGTRNDKNQTMAEKVRSVESKLSPS